jgi:DNA-binding MarR family transcriptional regulator
MDKRTTDWSIFSPEGHLLLTLSHSPGRSIKDLIELLHISERQIRNQISRLEEADLIYSEKLKNIRKYYYYVKRGSPMSHPVLPNITVGEIFRGGSSGDNLLL